MGKRSTWKGGLSSPTAASKQKIIRRGSPMIMIRVRSDGEVAGDTRKTWRGAACQQNGKSGDAHDGRAVRNQSTAAIPDLPDKRHVRTPLRLSDDLIALLVSRFHRLAWENRIPNRTGYTRSHLPE